MDSFPKDSSRGSDFMLDISVPAEPKALIEKCKSAPFCIPLDADVETMDVKALCNLLAERVDAIIYAIERGITHERVVHLADVRDLPDEHRRPTIRYAEDHFVEFGDDNEGYLNALRALKERLESAA